MGADMSVEKGTFFDFRIRFDKRLVVANAEFVENYGYICFAKVVGEDVYATSDPESDPWQALARLVSKVMAEAKANSAGADMEAFGR